MNEKKALEALELSGGLEITGNPRRCAEFFDALDTAFSALEEIQKYRNMEKRLKKVYGECDGLLELLVDQMEKHDGVDIPSPVFKARLLTDDDVDRWDAYKSIGTVDECRVAVEKWKEKNNEGINYRTV